MTAAHPALPSGPRNPGDAWVEGPDGTRMWGRFGSAGLLLVDRERGILMQHRAGWSHFGGTWGIPGGARHEGEAAYDAALRESGEEAAVPAEAVNPIFTRILDLGYWTYTTVGAETAFPFEPQIVDAESAELAWVEVDRVDHLPLHPGFASSWPDLRRLLARRPVLVVDAANVVGSRPDGWWRDRPGAATRLLSQLRTLAAGGLPADLLALDADRVWPRVHVVLEGEARAALDGEVAGGAEPELLSVITATASGDDAIVDHVASLRAPDSGQVAPEVTLVTSDRGLRERAAVAGARSVGAGALRDLLDALS